MKTHYIIIILLLLFTASACKMLDGSINPEPLNADNFLHQQLRSSLGRALEDGDGTLLSVAEEEREALAEEIAERVLYGLMEFYAMREEMISTETNIDLTEKPLVVIDLTEQSLIAHLYWNVTITDNNITSTATEVEILMNAPAPRLPVKVLLDAYEYQYANPYATNGLLLLERHGVHEEGYDTIDVISLDPDTGDVEVYLEDSIFYPRLHPDGRWLALYSSYRDYTFVVDLDLAEIPLSIDYRFNDAEGTWSDQKHFTTIEGDELELLDGIWLVARDMGAPESWSSDGKLTWQKWHPNEVSYAQVIRNDEVLEEINPKLLPCSCFHPSFFSDDELILVLDMERTPEGIYPQRLATFDMSQWLFTDVEQVGIPVKPSYSSEGLLLYERAFESGFQYYHNVYVEKDGAFAKAGNEDHFNNAPVWIDEDRFVFVEGPGNPSNERFRGTLYLTDIRDELVQSVWFIPGRIMPEQMNN